MSESSQTGATGLPERLGIFRILGLLGEGGSGVVYAARWGHREVALKVLHPALVATPRERERFFDEAKLLADITHAGVVKVLSFGAMPDGRPFLAMEKLEGESLASRLARGPFAVADGLDLFGQLVGAVEALHARALVHRDLKPENIFLVGDGRFAVLLDFGIAKELDAPASTVTQDGGVRGTPAYMAPERFFGQPASPHTDIYELGLVLYAMLVGRLPWANSADPEARLNPIRPSALGIALPSALETEILRALSTRPEGRPASVGAFLANVSAAANYSPAPPRQTADLVAPTPPNVDPFSLTTPSAPGAIAAAQMPTGQGSWQQPQSMPGLQQPTPGAQFQQPTPAPQYQQPGQFQQATPGQLQQATPGGQFQQATPGYQQSGPQQIATAPSAGKSAVWPWLLAIAMVLGIAAVVTALVISGDGSGAVASDAGSAIEVGAVEAGAVEASPGQLGKGDIAPRAPRAALVEGTATGVAAAARHHAADTKVLVAVRVRDLIKSEAFAGLIERHKDNKELAPLLVMAQMCAIDVFEDVEWATFGIIDTDTSDFDVVLSGDFDRAKVEKCVDNFADNPSALGWIDERTFFLSSRAAAVDSAWVKARVAGEGSMLDEARLGGMLAQVDRNATLWFVGAPGDLLDKVGEDGLPPPQAIFGALVVDAEIDADIGVRYADAKQAARAATALQKQLDEVPEGVVGKLGVTTEGSDVRFRAHVNAMITSLLVTFVEEELARRAE